MNIRHIILPLLGALAVPAAAQELKAELEVEQEIVPLERQAARLAITPTLALPPLAPVHLDYSDRVVATSVTPLASHLDPASWEREMGSSPYRGYLEGAFFPIFNARLRAGYRLVDNDQQRVSLFADYSGDVYRRGRNENGDRNWWRDQEATVALSARQALGLTSMLDITGYFGGSRRNLWRPDYDRKTLRGGAELAFHSTLQRVAYGVTLGYGHFGYSAEQPLDPIAPEPTLKAQSENQLRLAIDGRSPLGVGTASLRFDADMLMRPKPGGGLDSDHNNLGLLRLTPRYDFAWRGLTLGLGAELGVSFNDGQVLRIAPQAWAAYAPSPLFAASVRATGGSRLNTLASLHDGVTPYCSAFARYGTSQVPLDLQLQLTFGPWRGAYVSLTGAWACADDWLMPAQAEAGLLFSSADVSAWRLGAEAGFSISRHASVKASYQTTTGAGLKHCWYEWRDRARHVVQASARVTPLDGWALDVDYELRSGRRVLDPRDGREQPLGVVSTLGAGVSYRLTQAVTLSVRGQNLLDRHYDLLGPRQAQGMSALVGASVKF